MRETLKRIGFFFALIPCVILCVPIMFVLAVFTAVFWNRVEEKAETEAPEFPYTDIDLTPQYKCDGTMGGGEK